MAKCTLLVMSCDAYQDMLTPFFKLFKKYWPDCECDIVLSTESINYSFPGLKIKNVHPENANCTWTDRVTSAVNKINTEQIIFMLDDFFLTSKVNNEKIMQIVDWLNKDKRIANFTLWHIDGNNKKSKYPGFDEREKDAPYKCAVVAGIWNKKWLLKYYKKQHCNAWQFERRATAYSHKVLFGGKFYVLQEEKPDKILPYNLSEIGLYSGLWMKKTRALFKRNNIEMDFEQRGWYDPKYSSMANSRINGFSIKSQIFFFDLGRKSMRKVMSKDPIKPGTFKQVYKTNGRNCFKWIVSDIYGFSLSKLKIRVVYENNRSEIIDNETLSGPFVKIKEKFVFNQHDTPAVFVPIESGYSFKKIEISGKIAFPATREELKKSYLKSTLPTNDRQRESAILFLLQSFTSRDLTAGVRMDSVLRFDDNKKDNRIIASAGKFRFSYKIPPRAKYAFFTPSKNIGYRIENFDVWLCDETTDTKIKVIDFEGLPKKINGCLIFDNLHTIKFNVKGYDRIIITGDMKRGITPRQLRKLLNG